jgi:hypothetical protein
MAHPLLSLTVEGRQLLGGSGDVTLRRQHQAARPRMSGSAGETRRSSPHQNTT